MFFWQKPKCSLEVKQGERGAWRWTARSVGNQTVNGVPITDRQVVAVDTVQGVATEGRARAMGRAAMRGWKVVEQRLMLEAVIGIASVAAVFVLFLLGLLAQAAV